MKAGCLFYKENLKLQRFCNFEICTDMCTKETVAIALNAFYAPNNGSIETKTPSYEYSLSKFILKLILKTKVIVKINVNSVF